MVRPGTTAAAAALSLLIAEFAFAQTYRDVGGSVAPGVVPVAGDGSGPLFTAANPAKVSVSAAPGAPLPVTFGAGAALPGFASTPTVNIGALPALASGSNVIGAVTQSGAPWSVNGSLGRTWTESSSDTPGRAWTLTGGSDTVALSPGTIASLTPPTTVTVQQSAPASLQATVVGAGAAGSPSGGVVTVQGAASGLPLPVSGAVSATISAASLPLPTGAATSANQPTNAAIASSTSGETGHLAMAAAVSAAPSNTTAQTYPLYEDLAGNLRAALPAPTGDAAAAAGGVSPLVFNGSTWDRWLEPSGDAANVTGFPGAATMVWNGTKWDRARATGGPAATPGSAAYFSTLAGCVYAASGVTLANGNQVGVQCDAAGSVKTNVTNVVTTTPKAGTFASAACSLNAATSTSCLASGTYNHATVMNLPANAASVACQWTNTSGAVTSSSLTNGGSMVLLPGQSASWGPMTAGVPAATALYCIASAGAPNIYVESN